MSAAAVDTPVVVSTLAGDPNVAAQGQTPPVVSTLAEPKATPTERLETFVKDKIPEYRKAQPKAQEETESQDQEKFDEEQKRKKEEIVDKIKKIIEDADVKYKELSVKYKAAKSNYNLDPTEENYAKLNEISVSIDAVYDEKSEALDKIQEYLDGDTTPIFVKGVQSLFNFALNKIQAIFKKSQLANDALIISEETMSSLENISNEINAEIKAGKKANLKYLKDLVRFANDIVVQKAPPPTQSSPSEPGLLDDAAAAAKAAAAAATPPVAVAPPPPPPPPPPTPTPPPGGGGGGGGGGGKQDGGGISRKRSHPKYINQISENRNKIFKKELEIINSIRRFHRSHTIRKRDKINSILGFKKSRNNRNRNHDGNTKRHRHQHRHNNHKHKSAKHIKK